MSYDTINVSAGDTYTVRLSDGDVWENELIDISASGANYDIQADGSNWTIRNIGITGHFSGGHTEPFRARDTSSSGHSVIENVCLDVTVGDSNATGLYVYWNHAGHIEIDGMYLGNWTDNGVYASGPGNPSHHPSPGSGGTVAIKNTYSFNNHNANLRLGTDGSYCENCVMVDGVNRGYWGFYNHTELVDCDIIDSGSDIAISDSHWDDHAEVTCTDSRWVSETAHGTQSTNQIYGSPNGDPIHRSPEQIGAPPDAETAASGTASDPDPSPQPPDQPDGVIAADSVTHTDLDGGGWGFSVWTETGQSMDSWRIDALRDLDGTHLDDDKEQYEVIHIDEGDTLRVEVSDNETISNILYDVNEDGSSVTIDASGDGWAVEKVGVRGRMAADDPFISAEGNGTIDTVYAGDGTRSGYAEVGVEIKSTHSGHIDIRNTNVQAFGPYNFDAANMDGTVSVDACYSADASTAHLRIADGLVRRLVTHDGDDSAIGVWAYPPGEVTVDYCHLGGSDEYGVRAGANNQPTDVSISRTEIDTSHDGGYTTRNGSTLTWLTGNGTHPQNFVPSTCPRNADQAASAHVTFPTQPVGDVEPFPEYDGPVPAPAIYVDQETTQGDTHIERVNVQNYNAPAIYAENDRTDTDLIEINESYFANNRGANIVVGTTSDVEYEPIVVDEDTTEVITLDLQETLRKKLIDCGSPGANVRIELTGDEAAVRNVSVIGDVEGPIIEADADGTVHVEQCYLGDGGGTGVEVADTHDGELRIHDSAFHGFDLAVDASADAGQMVVDTCLFQSNGDSIHVGSDRSRIYDSIFWNDTRDGDGIVAFNHSEFDDIRVHNSHFTWDTNGKTISSGDDVGYVTLYACRFTGSVPTDEDANLASTVLEKPDNPEPEDFSIITVPSGETFEHVVEDEWRNVILDVSLPGAEYEIAADTGEWSIENVGITGETDESSIRLATAELDTGTMDHVYVDSGEILATEGHDGTIEITRLAYDDEVENDGTGDLTVDSDDAPSAPDEAAAGNEVGIDGWGKADYGDPETEPPSVVPTSIEEATKVPTVRDTHIREDEDASGIRAAHGTVMVYDSEIDGDPPRESVDGGNVVGVGTNWGDEAEPTMPDHVPAGNLEAASASVSDESDPQ